MKQKKVSKKQNIPEGILILSVLMFAGALFSFMLGSFFFNLADTPSDLLQSFELAPGILGFVGFMLIGFSVLSYFIGRGLISFRNWSRVTLIVLSGISVVFSFINLFNKMFYGSIFGLILNGLIIWYLVNPKVVKYYN